MRLPMMPMKANKQEKEYMERVRALGCVVGFFHGRAECSPKIEVHHPTGAGMGLKANHYDTIPLCFNHHSAQTPLSFGSAVHKGNKSFEERYGTQREMVRWVRKSLGYA